MKEKIKLKQTNKIREIKKTTSDKRTYRRTSVLLLLQKGKSAAEIADTEIVSESTARNIRNRYDEGGIDLAINDRERSGRPPILSDADKQRIAAKACSNPPKGFSRWTVRLLTNEIAGDENIPTVSRESVRNVLNEHHTKPWLQKMWCIPTINEEYVERMEDVLDVYERPYNPKVPTVCVDEKPIQLLGDRLTSIPATISGKSKKVDYQYERQGTANVFVGIEPKQGQYFTKVTERRTKLDFAEFIKTIHDFYPLASRINLVMDNLNTHNKSSLTEKYGEEIGSKIWSKFEVHYTPKHASWLDQAEVAIGIFSSQCLGKDRIPTIEQLKERTLLWTKNANKTKIKINWKFTTKKARVKFGYKKVNGSRKIILAKNVKD